MCAEASHLSVLLCSTRGLSARWRATCARSRRRRVKSSNAAARSIGKLGRSASRHATARYSNAGNAPQRSAAACADDMFDRSLSAPGRQRANGGNAQTRRGAALPLRAGRIRSTCSRPRTHILASRSSPASPAPSVAIASFDAQASIDVAVEKAKAQALDRFDDALKKAGLSDRLQG